MIVANDRGDHFRFSSVFIKKDNKTEILKKNRPVGSVHFFRTKTGSNRFGSVFLVWLGFFRFGSVFSVWLGFLPVWLGFFRFGFGSVFSVLGL